MPTSGTGFGPPSTLMQGVERCPRCVIFHDCAFRSLPLCSPTTGCAVVRERHFAAGDVLREEGADWGVVQVIKVGNVLASRRGADGVSRPVALWGRGHIMGRLEPSTEPNALSCQAVSAGRVCEVRVDDIGTALTQDFRDVMAQGYARAFALLADWAQVTRVRGVVGQVAAALVQLGRIQASTRVQLPGHLALAALLGTSRESVARALSQLERQGAVRRQGRSHCQLDTERLVLAIE